MDGYIKIVIDHIDDQSEKALNAITELETQLKTVEFYSSVDGIDTDDIIIVFDIDEYDYNISLEDIFRMWTEKYINVRRLYDGISYTPKYNKLVENRNAISFIVGWEDKLIQKGII